MFHPSVSDGLDDGPMITTDKLVSKKKNQINVIYPYRTKGGWSFDDAEVGLQGEPFISGIPEIIDSIVGDKSEFTAYISHSSIPNYTGHLIQLTGEEMDKLNFHNDSGWYKLEGTEMVGWLCPATLNYFEDYPKSIYFKIE